MTEIKSTWPTQFNELSNQSKFHEELRTIFCNEKPFKHFKCFQEVQCSAIVDGYSYTKHHYDWWIKELGVVIELHGRQHYQRTTFGKMGYDESIRQFKAMQYRDSVKKDAAIEAGYIYVEIPYTLQGKLTAKLIMYEISKAQEQHG